MKFFTPQNSTSENPKSIVFMLHGWGSHGQDLLPIAEIWQKMEPETLFLCLEAPHVCDANPHGFQWFALGDWSPEIFEKGAADIRGDISEFITKKRKEFDLPANKVVIMGFSQGMMMALSVGLRQEEPFAGILGYSGALIDPDPSLTETYPKTEISLIHGTADTVVPVERHNEAVKWLKNNGYSVQGTKVDGLAHGIEPKGLAKGQAFIRSVFSK